MKNIGIMAHVDAGKTTITEQLLYRTHTTRSLGSVDDGTAQTDYMSVERSRGISVCAAVTHLTANGHDINIIDTPGHIDFSAEVERAVSVLDGAVLVISAVEGVQSHTEVIFDALIKRKLPTIIFINKIDRVGADVHAVYEQIRKNLSEDVCLLYEPCMQEGRVGIAEVDFCESVALLDEALLQKYVDGSLTEHEARDGLIRAAHEARLYPVLCGSAMLGDGMDELTRAICDFIPDASGDENGDVSGLVFKITHDAVMGKTAYIRLFGGTLKNRDAVYNFTKKTDEKVTQIRRFQGEKYVDTGILKAGDIAAVYGLTDAAVGDILGSPDNVPEKISWVLPLLRVAVKPCSDTDYSQLVSALTVLNEEEPLLDFCPPSEGSMLLIKIMGIIQTEIIEQLLLERFNIPVQIGEVDVIYRETIAHSGTGLDSYTMPKPCWAVLRFDVEPLPRGSGIRYESVVSPKDLPYRYQNHVQTALYRALKQGIYGWEVDDIHVTLTYGQYHNEHTHPLDFFVATPMALAKALADAEPVLLEPLVEMKISAPQECASKIIGEIVNMSGEFDGPEITGDNLCIRAVCAVSKTLDFPIRLASISGGRARLSSSLCGYRECGDVVAIAPRRGVDPLERSKYILWARNAIGQFGDTL